MKTEQQPILWKALMITSIVLGSVVTWIAIYRHDLLPSLYANTHHQPHVQETEHVVVPAGEDTTRLHATVAEQTPLVGKEEATTGEAAALPSVDRKYLLIAGSFSSEENALRYQSQLESAGIHASLLSGQQGEKQHFRVVVGGADSKTEIAEAKRRMTAMGLKNCWVFNQKSAE